MIERKSHLFQNLFVLEIYREKINELEIVSMSIEEAVVKYSNMLYKICIVMLCNEQDVQDVIQDTFCKYLERKKPFANEEHEKAWLITAATNNCRNILSYRTRHPKVPIEELAEILAAPRHRENLTELLRLPVKLRTVIYLYYVEGYQVREIASILKIGEAAVKKRMQRGREQLRMIWEEEQG